MRRVAYALLGFGMLAFGALMPAPASADCYWNCDREYRPIPRHHPGVRYDGPVHHMLSGYPVQYRTSSCCGHSYYRPAYYVPAHFVRAYIEDSVPYDDVGYDDYSMPNGYYVSGIGGYGGAYRGLVSWHRYGHYDAGRHGFVGYRHAGFGGFHRFR